MKKNILILLLLLIPVLMNAEALEIDGIFYNLFAEVKQAEVTINPNKYTGAVIIPEYVFYDGTEYSVTAIGDYAFRNCDNLSSIFFPNSLAAIGNNAFSGCNGLSTLYITRNVAEIGIDAFSDCNGLISISVDNGNMKYDSRNSCNAIIETETNALIAGCKNTTIPNSIHSIGGAFKDCKGLTTVTIPNSVTTIGVGAFYGCSGLISVDIPNSVTSVSEWAFAFCTSLSSINLPNSITGITPHLFEGCSGLTSVSIPNSVTSIGGSAFFSCSDLTSVTIPNSVTYIGEDAFYGCQSLTTVTLPNSISEINDDTFSYCINLDTVIIPMNVTKIGSAFRACWALSNVFCLAEKVPETTSQSFNIPDLDNNTTLHVPVNSIDQYKSAYQWSKFDTIVALTDEELSMYGNIPQENTEIDNTIEGIYLTQPNCYRIYNGVNNTYGGCPEIFILDNGDGTYYVDDLLGGYYSQCRGYGFNYAMTGNIAIAEDGTITLKDSHVIGWNDGLTSLIGTYDAATSTFTIEAEYISGMKFYQTWVKDSKVFTINGINYRIGVGNTVSVVKGNYSGDIVIPNEVSYNGISYSVSSIGTAFNWCAGLTSVTIPSSVTCIGNYAFEDCSGLLSVNIPNSVTYIGDYAFSGCTSLISVTIPNGVTSIGSWAFMDCSGLTSVIIPNSITSIGDMAFACCDRLSDLILSDNLTTIGQTAFIACNCLKSLTIPKSVLKIGNRAFTECETLESIIVDSENIKYDSRNNCNAIIETYTNKLILGCKSTVIPQDVTIIGEGAFAGSIDMQLLLIPNSVTSIEHGAFWKCKGLRTLKIGNNVELIDWGAFQECSGLQSIIIPQKVSKIGWWAFSECTGLKDFYCYAETIPSTDVETFINTPIENATLHVPASSIEVYKQMVPWSEFGRIVTLTDNDPKPSSVAHLTVEDNNVPLKSYSIDGRQLAKPQRGLNIIRMSDETTRKVIVR